MDMLEMTENNVVPMPGLVWYHNFTPRRQKKNTCNTPCLMQKKLTKNISVPENRKKDCM